MQRCRNGLLQQRRSAQLCRLLLPAGRTCARAGAVASTGRPCRRCPARALTVPSLPPPRKWLRPQMWPRRRQTWRCADARAGARGRERCGIGDRADSQQARRACTRAEQRAEACRLAPPPRCDRRGGQSAGAGRVSPWRPLRARRGLCRATGPRWPPRHAASPHEIFCGRRLVSDAPQKCRHARAPAASSAYAAAVAATAISRTAWLPGLPGTCAAARAAVPHPRRKASVRASEGALRAAAAPAPRRTAPCVSGAPSAPRCSGVAVQHIPRRRWHRGPGVCAVVRKDLFVLFTAFGSGPCTAFGAQLCTAFGAQLCTAGINGHRVPPGMPGCCTGDVANSAAATTAVARAATAAAAIAAACSHGGL
eukprot:27543-Chlamydomonas_euryale.AAC.15